MTEATTAQINARIAHIRHVYGDADQDALLLEALLRERDRKAAKPTDGINAAIDRAAEQTRQAYSKRGMFAQDAIEHLVGLLVAEIAASQTAADCHQQDLVTADSSQPAAPASVSLRITGPNSDGEYWLHLKGGNGPESAGINLGGERRGMIASALLKAAAGGAA